MKLYGTVSSERASKGQGGNDFLEIKVQIEHDNKERERFCSLRVNRVGDEYMLHFVDGDGAISPNPIHTMGIIKKGEKLICGHSVGVDFEGQCNQCGETRKKGENPKA